MAMQNTECTIRDSESKKQNKPSISPPLVSICTKSDKMYQNLPTGMQYIRLDSNDSENKGEMKIMGKFIESVDNHKLDYNKTAHRNATGTDEGVVGNQQQSADTEVGLTKDGARHFPDVNRVNLQSPDSKNEQLKRLTEDEYKIRENVRKFEQSNSMYFTGRLPTLVERSRTITPLISKETEEAVENTDDDSNVLNENREVLILTNSEKSTRADNTGAAFDIDDNCTKVDEIKSKGENSAKVPTPSREIQKLIFEINAPAQLYTLSKEKPLTPRDTYKLNTEQPNLQEYHEERGNDSGNEQDKHVTVGELKTATSKIINDDIEKQSAAKYDELPHMKNILQYSVENHLQDAEQHKTTKENDEDSSVLVTRTVTEITENTNVKDKTIELNGDDRTSTCNEIEQTAMVNQQMIASGEIDVVKTSNSENDLKEMIASAKRAIEEDEMTTESTTEGASGFNSKGYTSTSGAWKTDDCTSGSNYDGLVCSKCLRVDSDFANSGFCHECQEYLCGNCRKIHKESATTMYHYVIESYCSNELKANKFIRATSYCKDCEIFLCRKCNIQHMGFRAFRHHKIVQSSFISRKTMHSASSESPVSLDESEMSKVEEHELKRASDEKQRKKRRKYVFEKHSNDPYGLKFDNVSESLYPGKNKKLAISYTSNPQWFHSSIPTLPYLVRPGSLSNRALKIPYLQAYKTPFYTKTKRDFDPHVVKLKALQARYNHPERKNFSRKEAGHFTARPLKNTEGVSLPDIHSIHSMYMGGKHSHHSKDTRRKVEQTRPTQALHKLKTAEFIRDECLSIPFPSNELPCLIGGMEVLVDGRLVVLDKRNNSIKLFSRKFNCKASMQFQNRIVDICASSIYPTDIYLATPKYLFDISAQKGLEVSRKMKVEIKRIEGLVCWKYGLAIISMKSDLSWEIRLLDFRGNLKSKLEILNPFTCEIERSNRYHVVASRGGKFLTLADVKNACAICVDVTTRCVVSETLILDSKKPSYLTADHQNNLYVSCGDEIQQVSAKGRNLGVVVRLEKDRVGRVGCIAYNTAKDQLYVQMKSDVIAIYKIRV